MVLSAWPLGQAPSAVMLDWETKARAKWRHHLHPGFPNHSPPLIPGGLGIINPFLGSLEAALPRGLGPGELGHRWRVRV